MTRPNNAIETEAAEWAARGSIGSLKAEQQAKLDAWFSEDPRHLGAYLRMQAVLHRVERLGAATLRAEQRRRPLLQMRWPLWLTGGLAAAFAVVFMLAIHESRDAKITTAVGQTQVASMPDGSVITLNTNSEVEVHYSLLARDVTLKHGEALFTVAKNKHRPFIVQAAGNRVRAVGTSFTVTHLADRPMGVMVREGVVEVQDPRNAQAVSVRAGSRAQAKPDGGFVVSSLSPVQLEHDLDWLEGRVFFRRQTLAAAAKEFAHYSAVRIVIDDPAVASKTVTGMFVANDPAAFARGASAVLGLEVRSTGKALLLSQKHH